jgi:hypothetical protein
LLPKVSANTLVVVEGRNLKKTDSLVVPHLGPSAWAPVVLSLARNGSAAIFVALDMRSFEGAAQAEGAQANMVTTMTKGIVSNRFMAHLPASWD